MFSSKVFLPALHRIQHQSKTYQHVRHSLRAIDRTASTQTKGSNEGYQSFGSFHSDNVEELIRLPKQQYVAPKLPFDTSKESPTPSPLQSSQPFANASKFAQSFGSLDRDRWTFLNHGAFGLALENGLQRSEAWRQFLESQPLRYFDRYLLNHLVHGARCMVDFVTSDERDSSRIREGTALIQNVTSGMNAVIGGHARCGGDNSLVFYFDIAYGSNKKICKVHHGEKNAIEIPFEEEFLPLLQQSHSKSIGLERTDWNPDSTEIFLSALDATICRYASRNGNKSSLAGSLLVIDHITSNTAIHLPINSIAKYAKEEYGMVVAVDGAHALLGLPLDMGNTLSTGNGMGFVDVYTTNAHKWFSSPRGSAVLFCANSKIRDTILARPAVVSHGVDDGFLSRFMWDGCRDYSAQLSLPALCDYWNAINPTAVRKEMQNNLKEGLRILISHWHPYVCSDRGDSAEMSCVEDHSADLGLTLLPINMHAPMMALVRLPSHASGGAEDVKTSTDAKRFQDFLYKNHIEVPIKCINGVLYARVSCHVYNTADEFEQLAKTALKF
ncbi:hypothetical protein ACHAWF_012252 [Thalassiosira exigua]